MERQTTTAPALAQLRPGAPFITDGGLETTLVFDDLVKAKPLFVTNESSEAFVTRPRVNFDPGYQTFLSSNGAI